MSDNVWFSILGMALIGALLFATSSVRLMKNGSNNTAGLLASLGIVILIAVIYTAFTYTPAQASASTTASSPPPQPDNTPVAL